MHLTLKSVSSVAAASAAILISSAIGFAQISPAEITDPKLKTVEQTYLPKLIEINRTIATTAFPFPFSLNRYVGIDPKEQAASDRRGLEFVNFHGRLVLKLTGNYNAAFNASLLAPNQRANKTFDEVILPVLRLMTNQLSMEDTFEAFGFEIGYHVRTKTNGVDYEGKEILVVVMEKADAFRYVDAQGDSDRQSILSRAEIFLNGKPFGLQRGAHDPISLEEAANRIVLNQPVTPPLSAAAKPDALKSTVPPKPQIAATTAAITGDDAEKLQAKYQSELDALAAEGSARFHFVQYAPPSLMVFRGQLFLQLTLRNTDAFDRESTSIYKRAAQTFDLFLAPQIKSILERLPNIPAMTGLGVTVLNDVASKSSSSSEALEFFFPLNAIQDFANAAITNQELINGSAVLVNGVRIALDLQRVE